MDAGGIFTALGFLRQQPDESGDALVRRLDAASDIRLANVLGRTATRKTQRGGGCGGRRPSELVTNTHDKGSK